MRNWRTLLGTLAVASATFAQPSTFTRARVPTSAELDRLNLKLSWAITMPVEGSRDGLATVQLIPAPDPVRKNAETALLVVQMRSGTLAVYDAESGRKLWSKRPAPTYPVTVPEVAYDPRGLLVV